MNGMYPYTASRPDSACTPDAVRIDVLDLCAEIFQGPDQESYPSLLGRELPELARRASICGSPLVEPLAILAQVSPSMASPQDISTNLTNLESTYVSLFINDRNGVQAPLYESCHMPDGGRLMGPPAEAMSVRLAQAGLILSGSLVEPPDHLSIELEYLAFVLTTALNEGNPALVTLAGDFAQHVQPAWHRWEAALEAATKAGPDSESYGRDVQERSSQAFFRAAARLTLAALESLNG